MNNFLNARIKGPLLKDALRKNRNILFIIIIILGLSLPVPMLLEIYYSSGLGLDAFDSTNFIVMYTITAILLMITPFLFFNYLTKKRSVDFMHSLPISRSDLFLTYGAASILIVLVPFTIIFWGSQFISYLAYSNTFQWAHLFMYIRAILMFGALQVPTLLVIMNTGTLSDSVIFTFILFVAPFLAYVAIDDFTSTYLLGFTTLSSTNILLYISPITNFLSPILSQGKNINYEILSFYWIVGAIIIYILSCSSYRNWKSEFAERPFNNDYFYPFVTSLFTAVLFIFLIAAFAYDYNAPLKFLAPQNLVLPILLSYVFYVILDFIRNRTAKYFMKASKFFIYIIIFSLSVTTILYTTQGFGYAWATPDRAEIETVQVAISKGYDSMGNYGATITDKEEIDKVLKIHKELVEKLKSANTFFNQDGISPGYTDTSIKLIYSLNDSGNMKRSFKIPPELIPLILGLDDIQSIAKARNPLLQGQSENEAVYDLANKSQLTLNDESLNKLVAIYNEEFSEAVISPQTEATIKYYVNYSDVNNEHYDGNYPYQLAIDSRFTKSIEYLESLPRKAQKLTYYFTPLFDTFGSYGYSYSYLGKYYYPVEGEKIRNSNDAFIDASIAGAFINNETPLKFYIIVFEESNPETVLYTIPVYTDK